jgi:hypothetical protein
VISKPCHAYRSATMISVLWRNARNFRYHSACYVRNPRCSRSPRVIRRICSISLRLAEHSAHARDNTSADISTNVTNASTSAGNSIVVASCCLFVAVVVGLLVVVVLVVVSLCCVVYCWPSARCSLLPSFVVWCRRGVPRAAAAAN